MGDTPRRTLATRYSNAEIWDISENSVLDAAQRVIGIRPSLLTPVDRYVTDEVGVMRYYGALQDILDNRYGLVVDFMNEPPLNPSETVGKAFIDIVYAVESRLHRSGEGE